MAARFFFICSVLIFEIACGIAALCALVGQYPYRINEEGAAGCVMIVAGTLVTMLMTLALFSRGAAKSRSRRLVDEARIASARILGEATDKALALCSLDAGRCKQCGNPRTGKFCPRCGAAA